MMRASAPATIEQFDALEPLRAAPPRNSRLFRGAIGFFVLTRVIVLAVALLAPQHRDRSNFPWWPANPLIRWDAGHYWGIMVNGYPPVIKDTTAFFPLYPLVAWPVWKAIMLADTLLTGHTYAGAPDLPRNIIASELALVLTAHAVSLAAVIVFCCWCRRVTDDATALRASMLLCAYPGALYFSAGYADGLFVLLVALMLLFSHQRRFWLAALACGLATATRPTGVAAAVVLMLLTFVQLPAQTTAHRLRLLIPLGLVSVAGIIAHECYLTAYYGRWDAYFVAQQTWEQPNPAEQSWARAFTLQPVLEPAFKPIKYAFRGQFDKLADARNWNQFNNVLLLACAIAGLCVPGTIPRPALLLGIFVFLMAYADDPFTGGRMLGITRYHLIGLPAFLWIAMRPFMRRALALSVLLAAWMTIQCFYVAGYVDWILVS